MLTAAIFARTAVAEDKPEAPPLAENKFDIEVRALISSLHAAKSQGINERKKLKDELQSAGLNKKQVRVALQFEDRFTAKERVQMLGAGINPIEVNGYPDFFYNQSIYALRNYGIGPEQAHDLLKEHNYFLTKDTASDFCLDEFEAFMLGVPYDRFESAQEAGYTLSQIISDFNEEKLEAEFGSETLKRFKKEMYIDSFDQSRYEIYSEVIKNFLDPQRSVDKPLALCSLPATEADDNHFFSKNFAPLLIGSHRLLITQADENELANLIVRLGKEQGFDENGNPKGIPLWVDCGHGSPKAIHKAGVDWTRDEHRLTIRDNDFVRKISPYIRGDVILESCSTAEGRKNYASWLRRKLPYAQVVYAASEPIITIYGIRREVPHWDANMVSLKKK